MEPLTGRAPRDQNRVPVTFGVSSVDGVTALPIEIDPATGELLTTSSGGGGGGGTSSTFGATFPTTGTAIGASNGTDMEPLMVDGSGNLLTKINVALPAGTNVIGHVITDSGSTIAVTQATAANLNATVVGTGTFVAQVTGTVTANAGTNLNTSLLALESGGNLATIVSDLTNGTQQTKITDGTNTANVAANNSTTTGNAGNPQLIAGTGFTTATLTLNSGAPSTAWFDMLNYAWVSVEVLTNTTPATLTWQTSGDAAETNVNNAILVNTSSVQASGTATTNSANATFHGGRQGRYFRVSSNNGAGSTTLVLTFFTTSSAFLSMAVNASQSGSWVVAGGGTAGSAASGVVTVQGIASMTALKVDGSGVTQPVSGTVTATPSTPPSTEVNGQTTGTTAGTAVQMASNALVNGVIVQALSANVTSIYVGTSSVSSSNGFELQPGQATSVGVSNTNAVWVVSTTNGDKVCWIGS